MEGLTPKQNEIIKERRDNDRKLVKDGARMTVNRENGTRRLHLTEEQETDAIVEYRLAKGIVENGVTVYKDEDFEIGETRVFTIEQILQTIMEFQGVESEDLTVTECIMNSQEEIIEATIKIKDDISLPHGQKGKSAYFVFEIKGFYPDSDSEQIKSTEIGIFFRNKDENQSEKIIRKEIEIEYAKTDEERREAANKQIQGEEDSYFVRFLEFDGIEWNYIEDDEEEGGIF
jgi:hypothetical protein